MAFLPELKDVLLLCLDVCLLPCSPIFCCQHCTCARCPEGHHSQAKRGLLQALCKAILLHPTLKQARLPSPGLHAANSSGLPSRKRLEAFAADNQRKSGSLRSMNVSASADGGPAKGMVLPFTPLSLTFQGMSYYVALPKVRPCWWELSFGMFSSLPACGHTVFIVPS